jgi:phospholipid transport system substrate-binding protein
MSQKILSAAVTAFAFALPMLPALPSPAMAQTAATNAKTSEIFIKNLADKAFAVLRDKSLKPADRDTKFRALLREGFALDVIGNAVLGKHRQAATPAQLQAFHAAFPDYVIRIYASRLTDYADTTVTVTGSAPVGTRGDLGVKTSVSGKSVSQPVKADWRVREIAPAGPKIIDLSLEGVSMVSTQRDEFDARIQAKGMDTLIAEIKANKSSVDVKKAAARK